MLDAAARQAFPVSTATLGLLLLAAPLGLPGQPQLQAALALACVFFWSVFRPDSMPPPAVFMLGLLADLLGLSPPGISVVVLLITHGVALRAARFLAARGFLVVWLAFVAVAAGATALAWALTCLLTFRLLPGGPALLQFGLAAGVYPALATMFTRAHRGLADPERA
jgi:rod shape-determining protein MreD